MEAEFVALDKAAEEAEWLKGFLEGIPLWPKPVTAQRFPRSQKMGLGIRVQRNSDGYILTQSHYVEKVLRKFGHYEDKPVVTPFDPSTHLKKNQGDSVSQLEYTQVLGSLMYIMNCTRPDLAYSLSRLSRYSHNPGHDHWIALIRVLKYLKHTINYGLHYTKYPPVLEGFCDANWISCNSESKSTSGYVFTLGGAAVSWKSSKQTVNTRSTMEAEFVALDKAAEEAEWLKGFLEGIPLWPKPVTAQRFPRSQKMGLGIRVQRNSDGYILTQSHYVEKVLRKFGHYEDKPVVTPFDPSTHLKKNQGDSVSQLEYTQVLGSLMYIMNCTRPDLAYSLSRLSRYSHNPGHDHWIALIRVLKYLKHTINYGLHYTKYPPVLEGFCDANWISCNSESKSTSGYVFTLGGAAVSWKSSKQTVNTRSTMEAEFVALDKVAEEAEWLKGFLEGIPLWPKPVTAQRFPRRVGEFLIPKFKMSSRFEASGVLKKMGLGDVLDLIEIVHESAVIEVDENGTTAAAATYAVIRTCSAGKASEPDEKLDFVADHPFMFLIREDMTGTVLFSLHGAGPQSSSGLITIILLEDVLCKQVNFLGFHYASYFCSLDYSFSLLIVLS
ncbi:hypothetical protein ACLB2K_022055 [Fragaria x ananassa]